MKISKKRLQEIIREELNEATKNKYASIYDMKKEMKEGTFDP